MNNNVLSLVKKDLIVHKKPLVVSAALITLFFVFYYSLPFLVVNSVHFQYIAVFLPVIILFMLLPVSAVSVSVSSDEKYNWYMRERTMPFTRNDSVKAKYLFALMTIGFIAFVPMIVIFLIYILRLCIGYSSFVMISPGVFLMFILFALISTIAVSIYLPVMYACGTKNDFSQVISLIIGLFAGVFVLLFWIEASSDLFVFVSESLLYLNISTVIFPVLSVLLLFLSYKLSCLIFERTEF